MKTGTTEAVSHLVKIVLPIQVSCFMHIDRWLERF